MSSNSEARKRVEEHGSQPMFVLKEAERLSVRARGQDALAAILDGARFDDWDALCDQLADRGLRVVDQ